MSDVKTITTTKDTPNTPSQDIKAGIQAFESWISDSAKAGKAMKAARRSGVQLITIGLAIMAASSGAITKWVAETWPNLSEREQDNYRQKANRAHLCARGSEKLTVKVMAECIEKEGYVMCARAVSALDARPFTLEDFSQAVRNCRLEDAKAKAAAAVKAMQKYAPQIAAVVNQ